MKTCHYHLDFGRDYDVTGACTTCSLERPQDFAACRKASQKPASNQDKETEMRDRVIRELADRNTLERLEEDYRKLREEFLEELQKPDKRYIVMRAASMDLFKEALDLKRAETEREKS